MINKCPRCGGEPDSAEKTLVAWIKCPDCGYYVVANSMDEATRKWNSEQQKAGECEDCKIT